MRKLFTTLLVVIFGLSLYAQNDNLVIKNNAENVKIDFTEKLKKSPDTKNFDSKEVGPATLLGQSYYDLQSNSSVARRLYLDDDGSMSAVWIMSPDENAAGNWPERGTGYNHYDGSDWGSAPTVRIEAQRTG